MIGTGNGMKATEDLEVGDAVLVDHQEYEVLKVASWTNGMTRVSLGGPQDDLDLEVATADLAEPIWEMA